MTSQKQSASTSSFASTVLPSAEVIEFRPTKRIARQPRAFTKISVSKMQCSKDEPEALFWDPSCRGFGLRALKSGRRTWIYQYRDEHKRTRRIALGDVSAVGLDAARQAARQHAASVTQGANPSVERKGKKSAPSVLKVIESYLAHAKTRQRPRSYQELNDSFSSMRRLFTTTGRRQSGAQTSRHCLTRYQRPPVASPQTVFEQRSVHFGPGACGLASYNLTPTL